MNSARERLHYPCAGYNVATVAGNPPQSGVRQMKIKTVYEWKLEVVDVNDDILDISRLSSSRSGQREPHISTLDMPARWV